MAGMKALMNFFDRIVSTLAQRKVRRDEQGPRR